MWQSLVADDFLYNTFENRLWYHELLDNSHHRFAGIVVDRVLSYNWHLHYFWLFFPFVTDELFWSETFISFLTFDTDNMSILKKLAAVGTNEAYLFISYVLLMLLIVYKRIK